MDMEREAYIERERGKKSECWRERERQRRTEKERKEVTKRKLKCYNLTSKPFAQTYPFA